MKKILSALLSVAVIASSFVVAFAAEGDPNIDVKVSPLTQEKYKEVMMEDLPAGTTPYQISVDFKNLPDLTYARSGGGVRLGAFSLKLYTDITKIARIQGMNVDQATEDWGADVYGILKVANDNIALNSIDNSISIVKPVTAAGDAFPYVTGEATADVDGVLTNAIVFYVAVSESITITDLRAQVNINNGSLSDVTMTDVETKDANIVIGTTEPDPEPEEPVAQSVPTAVFEPAVGDYVEVTLSDDNGQKGDAVKFSLPDNVKGQAKVVGFLKYTIGKAGDGRETPAAGDTLTAVLKSISDTAKAVTILTEKVK